MEKICNTCGDLKSLDFFHKRKRYKGGYINKCKSCVTDYNIEYNNNNREKIKKNYIDNKEQKKEYQKEYKKNNKEIINQRRKIYFDKNPNAKMAALLRTRIYFAMKLKNSKKAYATKELLGCTIEFFKEYIESKFRPNMNWENCGKNGWHFDHIKPCASFNLSDPEEQKNCFHYTNIQPLWATTEVAIQNGEDSNYIGNLEKHDRII